MTLGAPTRPDPFAPSALAGLGLAEWVERGRQLATEGHPTSRFLIVREGLVAIQRGGVQHGLLGPGEHFGAIGLLARLGGRPGLASATIVTVTRSLVHSLAPWEFRRLVDDAPELRARLEQRTRWRTSGDARH